MGNKHNPGCGCCGGANTFLIRVFGCFSLPLKHATVNVWSDAGKSVLLASGTTDASGNFSATLANGSHYAELSAERFNTAVVNPLVVPGNGQSSTTLTPATGYHCARACLTPMAYPLADTLFASNGFGAWTLTYGPFAVPGNQNGWASPKVVHAFGGCGPGFAIPCRPANAGTIVGMPVAGCPLMSIDAGLDGFDGSRTYYCPRLNGPVRISVLYSGGVIFSPYIPGESEFLFRGLGTGVQPPPGQCCPNCMFPPDSPDELIITE